MLFHFGPFIHSRNMLNYSKVNPRGPLKERQQVMKQELSELILEILQF